MFFAFVFVVFFANAQHYKKNGTPDMRYNENKQTTGSSYSIPSSSTSDHYQNGYQRSDGTPVQGHYKTNNDNTNTNNYSTSGNSNPYTGETGSRAKDYSNDATHYGGGKQIQEGSRGGQYYINDNGNKVYVPKQP